MNIQLANLSTDLRRLSNWIYEGKYKTAKSFIAKIKHKYKIENPVGIYKDVWKEIEIIGKNKEGRVRSADRAATLGSILLHESLKK